MLATLCATLLAAAAPPKLAALGFTGLNVTPDELRYYSDHFAQQLAVQGLTIVTQADLAAVVGLERQKQLMGCAEDGTSCLGELSSALGVDGIVTGSIARSGENLQLDIKVVAASDARTLSVYSRRVQSDTRLLDQLEAAAAQVKGDVMRALRPGQVDTVTRAADDGQPPVYNGPALEPEPVHASIKPKSSLGALGWLPAAAGSILVVVSVGLLTAAASRYAFLTSPDSGNLDPGISAQDFASGGDRLQTWGYVCLSVGLAAIIVGIVVLAAVGNSS